MAEQNEGIEVSVEELRAKYAAEQLKRLRTDGLKQFSGLKEQFEELDQDPYADPNFTRDAITEETEVVIVGGGFAGMLTGVDLQNQGITNFRIVEKGGDFGGTWYWNRYPGAACDTESYIYLPLLEETGFIPKEKYSYAPEIFAHAQRIGRQLRVVPAAGVELDGELRDVERRGRGEGPRVRGQLPRLLQPHADHGAQGEVGLRAHRALLLQVNVRAGEELQSQPRGRIRVAEDLGWIMD